MELSTEEKQDAIIALNMRCNYIETGDVNLSAMDVENMGKHAPREAKVKALATSQMETILRMRKLIRRLLEL